MIGKKEASSTCKKVMKKGNINSEHRLSCIVVIEVIVIEVAFVKWYNTPLNRDSELNTKLKLVGSSENLDIIIMIITAPYLEITDDFDKHFKIKISDNLSLV